MADLARLDTTGLARADIDRIRGFIDASIPENTRRAYRADWADWTAWAAARSVSALPASPAHIAAYLTDLSGSRKTSTIARRLAAIRKAHELAGHATPTVHPVVQAAMKGVRREKGSRPEGKAPLVLDDIKRMLSATKDDLVGKRTRALLLVGFAGAFRRSELADLEVQDLSWSDKGVVILVRRSKTDQDGEGHTKAIPYVGGKMCAALALAQWINAADIRNGPVFRGIGPKGVSSQRLSDGSIAQVVKNAAEAAGIDPSTVSGHSLRAGHVTEARAQGVPDADTMAVTGHKRIETLNIYDRRGNPFSKTSAGAVLGGINGKV
jgi:site-specific recombinase XerD